MNDPSLDSWGAVLKEIIWLERQWAFIGSIGRAVLPNSTTHLEVLRKRLGEPPANGRWTTGRVTLRAQIAQAIRGKRGCEVAWPGEFPSSFDPLPPENFHPFADPAYGGRQLLRSVRVKKRRLSDEDLIVIREAIRRTRALLSTLNIVAPMVPIHLITYRVDAIESAIAQPPRRNMLSAIANWFSEF